MLKVTKIHPCMDHIVTTAEIYTEQEVTSAGGVIDGGRRDTLKEYQKVLEIGPFVKGLKVGDIVRINPSRYVQILHKQGKMLKDADKKTITDDMHAAVDIPREVLYTKGEDGAETSQTVLILFESDIMCVVEGEEYIPKTITETTRGLYKPGSNIIIPPGGIVKN